MLDGADELLDDYLDFLSDVIGAVMPAGEARPDASCAAGVRPCHHCLSADMRDLRLRRSFPRVRLLEVVREAPLAFVERAGRVLTPPLEVVSAEEVVVAQPVFASLVVLAFAALAALDLPEALELCCVAEVGAEPEVDEGEPGLIILNIIMGSSCGIIHRIHCDGMGGGRRDVIIVGVS